MVRGQRVFCSNRGRRGGCGRTFAIFLAGVLPRHSVPSGLLARLLDGLMDGASVQEAVQRLRAPFALETFYRLRRLLCRHLDRVRVTLCSRQAPPTCGQTDPLLQTLLHLRCVFGAAPDAVAAFQLHFQRPFLG